MSRIGVMHVMDTLDMGGAERVAVNLVNLLPRQRYRTYLCTTRRDGPLADLVAADVGRLRLARRQRFDGRALWHLVKFVRGNQIQIIHAHESSIFIAVAASFFPPYPAIVWHAHFGRYLVEDRTAILYRLAARFASGVIAVSQPLAEWARRRLYLRSGNVWYVPNFVRAVESADPATALPGPPGGRIVCVANLRPVKDQLTLLQAIALVVRRMPALHLLLVGAPSDPAYADRLRRETAQQGLDQQVSYLGQREDVAAILRACDIGVLSSVSEGFPLVLLEYGLAGLPTVATQVGQCPEVLENGRAGLLVPAGSPDRLAEALLALLESPERRAALGDRLCRRVQRVYSAEPIIQQLCKVYETVLSAGKRSS